MRGKYTVTSIILTILLAILLKPISVQAGEPELQKIRCTCYCSTGNPTKDGTMPFNGIVSSNHYFGKTLILYRVDEDGTVGELIGIYEVRDTGDTNGLRNGTVIDMYRDTLADCYDWVDEYGDYCYIQVIDAVG